MGRYLTELADVIRAAGLTVVEIDGWQKRGWKGGSTPDGGLNAVTGGLVHHTATAASRAGDYPSLGIVRDGRPDVPGPLAQLGLGRSGTVYVVAAGRANHSGAVDDVRYSNGQAIGIEAEHPGDGSPWPPAQYAAYVRLCKALAKRYGIVWRGHKEAAVPYGRKIDPTFSMPQFRADVDGADLPAAPTPAPAPAPSIFPLLVDGVWGPLTTKGLQARLGGLLVDGAFGPVTVRRLQTVLGGLLVDGDFGPLTKRALQRRLGVLADGYVGPVTVRALQGRLNAGGL